MSDPLIIAVDAMGGENSPFKCLKGIEIFTYKKPDVHFKIYGDENLISKSIKKHIYSHRYRQCERFPTASWS